MAIHNITSVGGSGAEVYVVSGKLRNAANPDTGELVDSEVRIALAAPSDLLMITSVDDVSSGKMKIVMNQGTGDFSNVSGVQKIRMQWAMAQANAALEGVLGIYQGTTLIHESTSPYTGTIDSNVSAVFTVIGVNGQQYILSSPFNPAFTGDYRFQVVDPTATLIMNADNSALTAGVLFRFDKGKIKITNLKTLEGELRIAVADLATLDLSELPYYPYKAGTRYSYSPSSVIIPPQNQAPVVRTVPVLTPTPAGATPMLGSAVTIYNGSYFCYSNYFSHQLRDFETDAFIRDVDITSQTLTIMASEENKRIYLREVSSNTFGSVNNDGSPIYVGKLGLYLSYPDNDPHTGVWLTNTPATAYNTPLTIDEFKYTIRQQGAGDYKIASVITNAAANTVGLDVKIGSPNKLTLSGNNGSLKGTSVYNGSAVIMDSPTAFGNGGVAISNGEVKINYSAAVSGAVSIAGDFVSNIGFLTLAGSGVGNNTLTLNFPRIEVITSLTISKPTGNYGQVNFGGVFKGPNVTNGGLIISATNGGVVPNTNPGNQGRFVPINPNAFTNFTGQIRIFAQGNLCLTGGQLIGNKLSIDANAYLSLSENKTCLVGELVGDGYITKTSTPAVAILQVNSGAFTGRITSLSPIGGDRNIKLEKIGTGTLTMSGDSNYTGNTEVKAGTLIAGHNNAFGTGSITIQAGATLNKNGKTLPNPIVNNGGTVIN